MFFCYSLYINLPFRFTTIRFWGLRPLQNQHTVTLSALQSVWAAYCASSMVCCCCVYVRKGQLLMPARNSNSWISWSMSTLIPLPQRQLSIIWRHSRKHLSYIYIIREISMNLAACLEREITITIMSIVAVSELLLWPRRKGALEVNSNATVPFIQGKLTNFLRPVSHRGNHGKFQNPVKSVHIQVVLIFFFL